MKAVSSAARPTEHVTMPDNVSNELIFKHLRQIRATLERHGELLRSLQNKLTEGVKQDVECYHCGCCFTAFGWPAPVFCDDCSSEGVGPGPVEQAQRFSHSLECAKCHSCGGSFSLVELEKHAAYPDETEEALLCEMCSSQVERCDSCGELLPADDVESHLGAEGGTVCSIFEVGRCEVCDAAFDSNDTHVPDFVGGGKICTGCAEGANRCQYCGAVFHPDEDPDECYYPEEDSYVCYDCETEHKNYEDLRSDVLEDGIELWYQANVDV